MSKIDVKLDDISNNYSVGEKAADIAFGVITGIPVPGLSSGGVDFFTSFSSANLQGANLSYTDVGRASFENADLSGVNFSESNIDEDDLNELDPCGVTSVDGSKSDRTCR